MGSSLQHVRLISVLTTSKIKGFMESVLVLPTQRQHEDHIDKYVGCNQKCREGNPYFQGILGMKKPSYGAFLRTLLITLEMQFFKTFILQELKYKLLQLNIHLCLT